MRKFFAVAMGSLVALAGFAGTANASATVDLIWINNTVTATNGSLICLRPGQRNCPQLGTTTSSVVSSDEITLLVLTTAGPLGLLGMAVAVELTEVEGVLDVIGAQSLTTTQPKYYFTSIAGATTVQPDDAFGPLRVDNINAAAVPFQDNGLGLPAGATAYLGTVTFHESLLVNGTFDLNVGFFVAGGAGTLTDPPQVIDPTDMTFGIASVVNVPEPGALSLLVMGLGGMLLAGRGRK
jgi:hypothetical protein